MPRNFLIGTLIFLICHASAQAQISSGKRPTNYPCFAIKHPKIVNMPDSFGLKKEDYYAILTIDCEYDSLGKIQSFEPFNLFVKSLKTEKPIKKYSFYNREGINICSVEAKRYYNWAIESLPTQTAFVRRIDDALCVSVSNKNFVHLEYRLE